MDRIEQFQFQESSSPSSGNQYVQLQCHLAMANLEQRLRVCLPEPCDELERRSGCFVGLGRKHILWEQCCGYSGGFYCVVSRVERCRCRQYSDPLRGLLQCGAKYA